jgi:tape measure domain-containing protein
VKVAELSIDLIANIARLQGDMNKAQGAVQKSMANIERNVQRVQKAFAALGLGVGFGAMISQATKMADAWQGLENRLRLVTNGQRELAKATDDVFRIAQRTSSGMDSVGQVYQRFAQNAAALGINLGQAATLTETVSKAVAVSGASASAAEAALTQFGQALASGTLRGDELNSIMEQTPGLAAAIAQGLGVTVGALRSMGAEGKITSALLVDALSKAAGFVDTQFETRVKTVGQAFTELNNSITKYVGQLSQSTGASSTFASAISTLADNIDGIARALLFLAATAIPAAVRALWSLAAAMTAVPGMALVKVLSVAAGALLAFADKLSWTGDALHQLGHVWAGVVRLFEEGWNNIKSFLGAMGDVTASLFGAIGVDATRTANTFKDTFQSSLLAVAGFMDDVYAGFTGNLAAVWAAFKTTGENIKTLFQNVFNSVSRTVHEWVNDLSQELNKLPGVNIAITDGAFAGPEPYKDILEEAKKAFQEGQKVLGMRDAILQSIARSTLEGLSDAFDVSLIDEQTAAIKANGEAAGKANKAYQSLIATIRAKIEENQLEIAIGEKSTEADKLRIKVEQQLAAGKLKLTSAQKLVIEQALKALAVSEKELAISKLLAAADKQKLDLSAQAVKSAYDEARRNQDLVLTFGMSKDALALLTVSRLEDQLAQKDSLKLTEEQVKAIELLIEAHKQNAGALSTLEGLEKQKAQWEEWKGALDEVFRQVGQSLTDAIFDGGKSGRDLVRDLFKTLTLRVLIQPMMSSIQGAVTNQIGGLLGYQDPRQQGGVGGMLQNANSLNSIFGAGYQALTGASAGASTASLGYANAVGAFGGDSIGALISANGGWEGAMAGFGSAAGGAAAAGTVAGITSMGAGLGASLGTTIGTSAASMATTTFSASLGAGAAGAGAAAGGASAAAGGLGAAMGALGTAMPYIGAAVAVASMLGAFDSGPPKTRHGQRTTVDYRGGAFGLSGVDDRQAAGAEQAALAAAESSVKAANDLFARIGVNAGIESFYAIMESSVLGDRDGVASGGAIRIGDERMNIGVKQSSDMTLAGFGGWSSAEMLPRLQTDIQLTLLEAFQKAGDQLPDSLSSMLEGIYVRGLDGPAAQELAMRFAAVADGATQFLAAIETLPFELLKGLSFDAAAGLVAAAGGFENLTGNLNTYYDNFYTDAEKVANASDQVGKAFSDLGYTMPDLTLGADAAKLAFRGIVESLDLTTEEGQRMFAALTGISGGFAQLITAFDELNAASSTAARSMADILRERLGLEGQLLSLQGDTAEIRRRELAALDESNHGLQRHIWALQEQAQAASDAATKAQEAKAALESAYQAVVQAGQAQIAELQKSFSVTDAAMNAYRSKANEQINALTGVFDAIGRGVSELRGQVESTAQMQYDQARAVISTALVTGTLPKTAGLTEAMRVAQQGVTGKQYGSQFEQQKALLTLANEMEALQGIAKPELDATKATLSQLEDQYALLRGTNRIAGESLAALEAQLRSALATEDMARGEILKIEEEIEWAKKQYEELVGINTGITDLASAMAAFAEAATAAAATRPATGAGGGGGSQSLDYYGNNPDVWAAYLAGNGGDMSAAEFAKHHYDEYGKHEGRSFDVGTPYVPYDMSANIHKGEIIIDPRSSDVLRKYGINVQGSSAGNKELIAEIRQLREDNRKMTAYLYQITKETKRTALNTEDTATAVGAHGQSEGAVVVY